MGRTSAAGVDEPRQLVTGKERSLERRVAWEIQMVRVREDGVDHDFRIPLLAQDRRPVLGVLVERRVDLVVEVVQESRHPPQLLVLTESPGVESR